MTSYNLTLKRLHGDGPPRETTFAEAIEWARRVGALLGASGFTVVTGGYGGVMEGASRGAREAGGITVGVTSALFGDRAPNAFIDHEVQTADLYERTRELIDRADGFVILEGKAGTLAELTWLWALHRAGCLSRRPVILLGDKWPSLLRLLERSEMLDRPQIEATQVADRPERVVALLEQRLGGPGASV